MFVNVSIPRRQPVQLLPLATCWPLSSPRSCLLLLQLPYACHRKQVRDCAVYHSRQYGFGTAHPNPVLVKCMSDPTSVPLCIKDTSQYDLCYQSYSTCPRCSSHLRLERSKPRMEVQRRTVVVIGNLVKSARDPVVAATYLGLLVTGVNRIASGTAFSEVRECLYWAFTGNGSRSQVRALSQDALNTLRKARKGLGSRPLCAN